jgi:hypothetical protein
VEFQFGTNWAEFSKASGGVIGQTLAMEGVFSFFVESGCLGLFLYGEKKLERIGHWWAGFLVFFGSWMSGDFIVATDAWMQHPTGHRLLPNGEIELAKHPLTLQWKPRSVGIMSKEPTASRKLVLALKLCATLLAISMATMPVCSARCAAQACAVLLPNDGAGGCHHSSSDSVSRGMKSKTMNVSCAAGEVVFTLLRAERDSPAKKSSIRPGVSPAPAAPSFDVEDVTPVPSGGIAPPQQISFVSVSQAPLRL